MFLSRKKVIVKRLDAIQNFGAMDVLCTDKTGTLTQDKIFLARHVDVWGQESDDVLEMAYLNSYYQTGLKNLLDVAVLEHVEVHRELNVGTAFAKVDEIPFDFTRRRMSVVVVETDPARDGRDADALPVQFKDHDDLPQSDQRRIPPQQKRDIIAHECRPLAR